jgi:hypothetical protein
VGAVVLLGLVAGCGSGGPPSAEQRARAERAGFSADLVYVADLDGWDVAAGGSGVYGADGFQVVYVRRADELRLTSERRALDAASCPRVPVPAAMGPVVCAPDGAGWRRTTDDRQEYAQVRDGVLVRASGPLGGDYGLLRDAVTGAHPASGSELEKVLPADRGGPVERGDVTGDNAPDNRPGPGG